MALEWDDSVRCLASAPGTADFTGLAAVTGHTDFTAITNGATFYYSAFAVDSAGARTGGWETGTGTKNSSTIERTTVSRSSNSDAKVNFTGDVHVTVSVTKAFLNTLGAGGLVPSGRLTLTTGVPVLVSDVASATTIYYALYAGNLCPIYSGSAFVSTVFTELSLALDSDSGHTGYHQSGKNFDLFVYSDGGTVRLGSGPAWTSDTGRGTGAGTTELARINGVLVNAVAITLRFGSASGNTTSVSVSQATYVGSFRASANGTTTWEIGGAAVNGDPAFLYLWNMYHRRLVTLSVRDTADEWAYTTATFRSKNNSTSNRVTVLRGLNEDGVLLLNSAIAYNATPVNAYFGIALDATNAADDIKGVIPMTVTNTPAAGTLCAWNGYPGLGLHFLQATEYSDAVGTTNWQGDAGGATPRQTGMTFMGMM